MYIYIYVYLLHISSGGRGTSLLYYIKRFKVFHRAHVFFSHFAVDFYTPPVRRPSAQQAKVRRRRRSARPFPRGSIPGAAFHIAYPARASTAGAFARHREPAQRERRLFLHYGARGCLLRRGQPLV